MTEGKSTQQFLKKYYLIVGLLKHGFLVTASRLLKEMCEVSTLSFHTGTAEGRLMETYLFPKLLAGVVYLDFPRNVLSMLLQDVHLQIRIHLWFMHDSLPPYFLLAVREIHELRVSRTMDTTVDQQHGQLVHLISIPYISISGDVWSLLFMLRNLQQRIQNGFKMARMIPGIFQRVRQLLFERANSCVGAQSGHLGHFL